MGNTVQKNNITEKINNKTTQQSTANCSTTASSTIKDVPITLIDSNGNTINVENKSSIQASCILANTLMGSIMNSQSAQTKNSSSDAMGAMNFSPRSSKQVNNITEQTNNVVKQILTSSCVNIADQTIDSIPITFIGSNKNTANIINNLESNTNCTINNLAKNDISNSQSATASNTKTEDAGFVIIAIVFIIAILAGVGIYIFIKYGKNSPKQQSMVKSMVEMQPSSSSYLPPQPSSSNLITNLASSSSGQNFLSGVATPENLEQAGNLFSKYVTPENINKLSGLFSDIPPV